MAGDNLKFVDNLKGSVQNMENSAQMLETLTPQITQEMSKSLGFINDLSRKVGSATSTYQNEQNLYSNQAAQVAEKHTQASTAVSEALATPFYEIRALFDSDMKSISDLRSEERLYLNQLQKLGHYSKNSKSSYDRYIQALKMQMDVSKTTIDTQKSMQDVLIGQVTAYGKIHKAKVEVFEAQLKGMTADQLKDESENPDSIFPKGLVLSHMRATENEIIDNETKKREFAGISTKEAMLDAMSTTELQQLHQRASTSLLKTSFKHGGFQINASDIGKALKKKEDTYADTVSSSMAFYTEDAAAQVEYAGAMRGFDLLPDEQANYIEPQRELLSAFKSEFDKVNQEVNSLLTTGQQVPPELVHKRAAMVNGLREHARRSQILVMRDLKKDFKSKEAHTGIEEHVRDGSISRVGATFILGETLAASNPKAVATEAPQFYVGGTQAVDYSPVMQTILQSFQDNLLSMLDFKKSMASDSGQLDQAQLMQKIFSTGQYRSVLTTNPEFALTQTFNTLQGTKNDPHELLRNQFGRQLAITGLTNIFENPEIQTQYGPDIVKAVQDKVMPFGAFHADISKWASGGLQMQQAIYRKLRETELELREKGTLPANSTLAEQYRTYLTSPKIVAKHVDDLQRQGGITWKALLNTMYGGNMQSMLQKDLIMTFSKSWNQPVGDEQMPFIQAIDATVARQKAQEMEEDTLEIDN